MGFEYCWCESLNVCSNFCRLNTNNCLSCITCEWVLYVLDFYYTKKSTTFIKIIIIIFSPCSNAIKLYNIFYLCWAKLWQETQSENFQKTFRGQGSHLTCKLQRKNFRFLISEKVTEIARRTEWQPRRELSSLLSYG